MTHLTAGEIILLIVLVLVTFGACLLPGLFRKVGYALRRPVPVKIHRDDLKAHR